MPNLDWTPISDIDSQQATLGKPDAGDGVVFCVTPVATNTRLTKP